MDTVLTLTMNPAIDKSASVDRVAPEMKLRCNVPTREPGGGGVNVTRAMNHLGGQSVALYPCGGPQGEMLKDLLDAEKITHHAIPVDALTRENLVVFERATGQQYRFGMPGETLSDDEWKRCLSIVADTDPTPDYIVGSGSLPPGVPLDFYARVAGVAQDIGARMILDTSGEALQVAMSEDGIHHPVYLLKPNMRELAQLTGVEVIEDEEHQEAAAMQLIESGKTEYAMVSLGAQGALLATPDGCTRYRAPSVPVRSAVGAGDSMVGGAVLRLAQGHDIVDAVRYGIAAGSAAVMTEGTQLCRKDDTDALYQRISLS